MTDFGIEPVTAIEVIIDRTMPPDTVHATADGSTVRVTVAPGVDATALAVLAEKIADAVVEAALNES
jgi:hypothetical protein